MQAAMTANIFRASRRQIRMPMLAMMRPQPFMSSNVPMRYFASENSKSETEGEKIDFGF